MSRKLLFAFTLLLLIPAIMFAQDGKLRGKVTDSESGEPLIGANVVIEGTNLGASTDINGEYVILSIPPGTYTVRASYIGYASYAVANFRIGSNITETLDFTLSSTAIAVEAVEVVAERPLIQRNTTNTIRVTTQENIENLPIRGLQNIVALEAGIAERNGNLYVRGGRAGEIAYFLDGANTTNPLFNSQNVGVIQEAIEELQVQSGGFTAEYGGAASGLIRTTMRTGGTDYKFTFDYQTDDFAKPGSKFLGTTSTGYRNIVLTAGGPIYTNNIRFFLAGQHNFVRNRHNMFLTPFTFDNLLTDDKGSRPEGTPLPYPVEFKENYLYNNWQEIDQLQGTLLWNLDQFKIKLSGSYEYFENPGGGDWPGALGNYFNQAFNTVNKTDRKFISGRFTHILNPTTFYEVGVSWQQRYARTYDPELKHAFWAYGDSGTYARMHQSKSGYASDPFLDSFYEPWTGRYEPMGGYSTIFEFNFAAPWAPNNGYFRNKQTGVNATLDFTSQISTNFELKAGGSLEMWTMRQFNIGNIRNLLDYLDQNNDGTQDRTFASDYEKRIDYIRQGGVDAYGYHWNGSLEETDKTTDALGRNLTDGPAEPFMASAYVQTKFEYENLILNVGARYELFDPKITTVPTTVNSTTGEGDYQDPPYDYNLDVLLEDQLTESDPYSYLLPRVTFSYPVTDRTVFYALYGKFVQMPQLSALYMNNITLSNRISPLRRIPYNLGATTIGFLARPERLTQYEIGLRQSISDNFAFTLTGFYKDTRDQLQITRLYNSAGVPISTAYQNVDFGTQKGLELTLELRRTERLAARVNYTLSDARGTGSTRRSSQNAVSDEASARFPSFVVPLDFNQTHVGSLFLDYRWGRGDGGPVLEGFGVNVLVRFNSGHNYTRIREPQNLGQASAWNIGVRALIDSRSRNPVEPINSSTTPWYFNTDLTINKMFFFEGFNFEIYARILNLFNTKNVINVYPTTGTPFDDGWLKSPFAAPYKAIPNYEAFYKAINLDNRWAYMNIGAGAGLGQIAGSDLYGEPREIRLGIKVEI